jgi:CHAT domain-containing protein/lipopolysaccharide biosynthesis regulator YciM
MSLAFRKALPLLILSLSLVTPALAQSSSNATESNSSDVKDLAVALVRTKSEQEQDQLLTRKGDLKSGELLLALKGLADPFVQRGEHNEALRISHLAVKVAEKTGDRMQLAVAMCDLGVIYARRIPPREALNYLQKSLAVFKEVGDKRQQARALAAMGDAYENDRRRELAVQHYEKSLALSEEIGDRRLTARIFNGLGQSHSYLGDHETGMSFYLKARALSEELNDKEMLSIVLQSIATNHISNGSHAEALDYLQKSIKITEELGPNVDRRALASKLQSVGLIYRRQGDLDQALTYARRTLAIFEEVDDKFGIANLQNNIGVIAKLQEHYEEALEWHQKALQGYEALKATPGIARSFNNIGDTYRLLGRYDKAFENLQKGFQIREQSGDRAGMVLSLNYLGRLYQDQNKYAEMLDAGRRAAKLADNREDQWIAQDRIGRALLALGRPAEARENFLAAIDIVESLRREVAGGEQQQQSFLERKLSPWLGMIDVLVAQGKYAEALTFAEQTKARVLLDVLQSGRTNLRKSWSQEEQQTEAELRQRLVSLNSKFTNEGRREKPDAKRVAELKAEVEKARLEYEDFETKLYVAHPELKAQRGEAPIVKAEELASLLPDGSSALLEYVVGEDKTYLFVVTKGSREADVRVYTLPIKKDELAKQTELFRQQLASRDLGFRASAAKLYELLLKPAAAQLSGRTNLIIAPDNTLWDLPFQTLVNGSNRFLIEDAAVAYAPSLTVLREMTRRRKIESAHATGASLLALGNPELGTETLKRAMTLRDGKLEPLPEAEQEVKALGRLYGVSRSKVYVGAEAREDRVKSEASRAKILHFATHGILNNASPLYSHLALAEGGANEDGLLEAWELMQLDLQADLAVLSACETARGRVGAGEGMIGFSWAMFIAGVPSIVVSQWKVESAGTRDLMVNFHRGLLSSKSTSTKTEALRQAALKVLKNPETNHPFYWGGFILVGDGR